MLFILTLLSSLQKEKQIHSIHKFQSSEFVSFRTIEELYDIETLKARYSFEMSIAYGLKIRNSDQTMLPTGEILFEPKTKVDVIRILDLIDGRYENYTQNRFGVFKLKVKNWAEIIPIANEIYESGLVNYCHPNFIAQISKMQAIPTDPLFQQQYYLNQPNNVDINAPQAWTFTRGLIPTRVAVIDDGVEMHEDLAGRVLAGFTPTNPNGFGAPANPAWPANIFPFSPLGHGQSCAGIIAATHNNIGVSGVSPCTQILPVNIFSDWFIDTSEPIAFINYREEIEDIRDAIDWAWEEGASDVISNSWGFTNPMANFDDITFAINRARTFGRGGLGSVVVFASGNSGTTTGVLFPASVNGVITVGAVNSAGNIWSYSCTGSQMDLVAPSGNVGGQGDVVTTDRMGNLGYHAGNYTSTFGGTSAAAPQVSGVAALMLSVNPNLTEVQVRNILQQTATDMGTQGFDNTYGFGRLNAQAAIQASLPTISGPNHLCSSNTFVLQNAPAGSTISWSVTPTSRFSGATSGTGATANLSPLNSFTSGPAVITYTITANCGSLQRQRTFWVGRPSTPGAIVGNTNPSIGSLATYLVPSLPSGATSMSWILPYCYGCSQPWSFWSGQNSTQMVAQVGDPSGYVQAMGTNPCGNGGVSLLSVTPDGSGCGSCPIQLVYPNPASEELTLAWVEPAEGEIIQEKVEPYEVTLYDLYGTKVYEAKSSDPIFRVDVSKLKNGFYFIHVLNKYGLTRKQIRVER